MILDDEAGLSAIRQLKSACCILLLLHLFVVAFVIENKEMCWSTNLDIFAAKMPVIKIQKNMKPEHDIPARLFNIVFYS